MKLLSPDGGDEASNTKRSTANNSDSTTSMDRNAVNMTMENSQLKKQLAVVGWTPKISDRKKKSNKYFSLKPKIDKVLVSVVTSSSDQQLQLSFTYFFRTLIRIRHVDDE